ncbi:MAG: hypothetical protein GXO26_04765 [Crenarchaeota archaeon]|nr:hypothetical protein [Thermoproteota archaeon]
MSTKLSPDILKTLEPIEELLNRVCMDDDEYVRLLEKITEIISKVRGDKRGLVQANALAKVLGQICEKKRIVRHEKHVSAIYFSAKLVLILLDLENEDSRRGQKAQEVYNGKT